MSNIKTQQFWEERHINDFWNWVSQSEYWKTKYFTRQVGRGLVKFISKKIPKHLNHLDYGCGNGDLLNLLIKESRCLYYGLEYSEESAKLVESNMSGFDNWKGCSILKSFPSELEAEKFELITFIETIEHLKDDMLEHTLTEIQRLLKKNGYLIITCPYDENLSDNHVFCPFCNSEFHRMQHMRSFNKETLPVLLESFGFKTVYCQNVNFGKLNDFKSALIYGLQHIMQILKLKKYPKDNNPHLVGIFTK